MYNLLMKMGYTYEMIQISNEAILEGIKLKSQFVVSYLYEELFPGIEKFVNSNSGSDNDAQDIFQEAIIIIYQKATNGKIELSSSFKAYFFGVCKNLWLKKLTSVGGGEVTLDESNESNELTFDSDLTEELNIDKDVLMMALYQKHFLELSEECQKLMKLSLQKVSYKEIAKVLGLVNENYAKTRKFMCKEKLKKKIVEDPQYINHFGYE